MRKVLFAGGAELHEVLFYGEAEIIKNNKKYAPVGWYCVKINTGKNDYDMLRFMDARGKVYCTVDFATINMFEVATLLEKKGFSFTAKISQER